MFRDILIYGDPSPAFSRALRVLEASLDPNSAHVTAAVFRHLASPATLYPLEGGSALWSALAEKADADYRQALDEVRRALGSFGVPCEVRGVETIAEDVPLTFANHARYADVAVVPLPADEDARRRNMLVFEEALFSAGRPVLALPEQAEAVALGRRVLVAWSGTREATRAVHDAMPILVKAEAVRAVAVDRWDMVLRDGEDPAADIAAHLSRHGVPVEAKLVPSMGKDIAEVLLAEANYLGADMLVLGGYGHSRTREWLVGGVTRDLLARSTRPMLLSH